ncbi:MAG: hypothetical protein ACJAR2_002143 [Ilumatobacter sp.]
MSVALVVALAVASCSSDQAPSSATQPRDVVEATTTQAPEPVATEPVATEPVVTDPVESEPIELRVPAVEDLGDAGEGTITPLASARLPEGYTQNEFSFTGEAASYEALGTLGTEGAWDAEESGTVAPYTTRMIVRTPPPEQFSGVVLVEWNNVTAGTDTTPDWGWLHEMIGREGHAYVAVSAQFVGVMGDDDAFLEGGLADISGLPAQDPVRYGNLDHPGDAFAFDIFTEAGSAVFESGVLGGLEPTSVIALGESQSAAFMAGYINAIHPLVDLYDGFLVHSRGANGTPPDGQRREGGPEFTNIRTDVNVPVLQYVTETDVFGLGFLPARQPDSDSVRTWEVAGTSHADAYTLFASGLERDAAAGSILGCPPVNDGPQHETLAAAVHHLISWVVDGTLPPESPLLDVDGEGFVRDDLGIVTGGIRTPVVDIPLRVLTGEPGSGEGACFLLGQTLPLGDGVLASLYGSLGEWTAAAQASADAAVKAGWLLPEDAASMLEEGNVLAVSLGLS